MLQNVLFTPRMLEVLDTPVTFDFLKQWRQMETQAPLVINYSFRSLTIWYPSNPSKSHLLKLLHSKH